MEGGEGARLLEDDKGLDFIIPLLMFLEKTCNKVACHFFKRVFKDAGYVKDNIKTPNDRQKTLTDFLHHLNKDGKEERERSTKGTKGKKKKSQQTAAPQQSRSSAQHSCLNPASHHQNPQGWQRQQTQDHQRRHSSKWTGQANHHHVLSSQSSSRSCQSQKRSVPLLQSHTQPHYSSEHRRYQNPSNQLNPSPHQRTRSHWGSSHCQKYQSRSDQTSQSSQNYARQQQNQNVSHRPNRSTFQCQSGQNYPCQRTDQRQQNQQGQPPQQPAGGQQHGPQGQPSAQATDIEKYENRRMYDVQNIEENEDILNLVTVGDMLDEAEACQELEKLDINFILNAILNRTMKIPLNDDLLQATCNMKDVRKDVVHPKYDFTEKDFEEKLKDLEKDLKVFYSWLKLDQKELQSRIDDCCQKAKMGNIAMLILGTLSEEVNKKYVCNDSSFVPPDITLLKPCGEEAKTKLNEFIEGQQGDLNLILLSGEHREEKKCVLKDLAANFKGHSKFKLVVHVNERHCRHLLPWTNDNGESSAKSFQDQVFSSLTHLAPNTVFHYGLDSVKATVECLQRDILFLVDWNESNLERLRTGIDKGTWVLPYQGKKPPLVDCKWKMLRLEPYTESQVCKMINYLSCNDREKKCIMDCYKGLDNKDILTSLNMIQMFFEVSSDVSEGTDFELVEKYIEKTLQRCGQGGCTPEQDKEVESLGRAAFSSVYRTGFISEDISIGKCVRDFLCHVEGRGWSFKHSNVRDFMTARYMSTKLSEACQNQVWENIVAFKRVFKFACFMWCRNKDIGEKQSLANMEKLLKIYLNLPKKEEMECSELGALNEDKTSDRTRRVREERVSEPRKEEEMECSNQEAFDKGEASDRISRAREESVNKPRDSFDSWDFLLDLDDACWGMKKFLKGLMSIISGMPCWCFDAAKSEGLDKRLNRLEKVLQYAALNKNNPLTIKLKSSTSMKLITEVWKTLKRVGALYNCTRIIVDIEEGIDDNQIPVNELKAFFETVAETDIPLYITRYKGPLIPSNMSRFLKCTCMQNLEVLEVCVSNLSSLGELMFCGAKEIHVRIALKSPEQQCFPASIEFPSGTSVHIVIEYFYEIQQLLNCFSGSQQLRSLSIHGLYVVHDFRLDFSAFSHLETLNIRFEQETIDMAPEDERMEVVVEGGGGSEGRLLRSSWLSHLHRLTLPDNLQRLLLRNISFFGDFDSIDSLISEVFQKKNRTRLIILDTIYSLSETGRTPYSQIERKKCCGCRRRSKRRERSSTEESAGGKIRPPNKEMDAMNLNEREDEKEVVIAADGSFCFDCGCSPCSCDCKVGDEDGYKTDRSITELIKNISTYSKQYETLAAADVVEHLRRAMTTEKRNPFALTIKKVQDSTQGASKQGTANYLLVQHFQCGITRTISGGKRTSAGEIKDCLDGFHGPL